MMKLQYRLLVLCVCVGMSSGARAEAADATLTWNPNPEPQVTGYLLSIGNAPSAYTQTIDVGDTLTWTVRDLDPQHTYYFALQAYDSSRQLSPYSSEVVRSAAVVRPEATLPGSGTAATSANAGAAAHLFWQHEDGWLAVWSMSVNRKLDVSYLAPRSAPDSAWRVVGAGDFNRDRFPDLVWRHRTNGQVMIWEMNNATMRSSVMVDTEIDPEWNIVAAGDMNGDKDPDLIWQHTRTGRLAVWYMFRTTFLGSAALTPASVAVDTWRIVGAGDFDLDGRTDLLWQHKDGTLSAWFMNGVEMRKSEYLSPSTIDPAWKVVAVADVNYDKRSDVVFRHEDGRLAVWLMNVLTRTSSRPLEPAQVSDLDWKIVGPK